MLLNTTCTQGTYVHMCVSAHVMYMPYIHTCMHACIHTYITYIHTCIHTYIHTCIHAYMHTCIHAYMHTCIHAYMHTCIHTYIHFMYVRTYVTVLYNLVFTVLQEVNLVCTISQVSSQHPQYQSLMKTSQCKIFIVISLSYVFVSNSL